MRAVFLTFLVAVSQTFADDAPIDWFQPPVACIEELVAHPEELPCLDLTAVRDPQTDLPPDFSETQIQYWTVDHKLDLTLCRAKEVMRRESRKPGSFSAGAVYTAYLRSLGGESLREKVRSIYEASAATTVPPQILFGALYQESLLAGLMIAPDGGNYSCGPAQMNLQEWCYGMQDLSPLEQQTLGWPTRVKCSALSPGVLAPFHDRAKALAASERLPEYQFRRNHYANITYADVAEKLPPGSEEERRAVFAAALSFTQNCSDYRWSILAKAKELRRLFDVYVPSAMKSAGIYPDGTTFSRSCRYPYPTKFAPLHAGWLVADAIYNAGSREVELLRHYFKFGRDSDPGWATLTGLDVIEGLHWGGRYNPESKAIEFKSYDGVLLKQSWFKSCIVQRHIARVIQYATAPGETIAQSLEVGGCVQGTVPESRMQSSGVK